VARTPFDQPHTSSLFFFFFFFWGGSGFVFFGFFLFLCLFLCSSVRASFSLGVFSSSASASRTGSRVEFPSFLPSSLPSPASSYHGHPYNSSLLKMKRHKHDHTQGLTTCFREFPSVSTVRCMVALHIVSGKESTFSNKPSAW